MDFLFCPYDGAQLLVDPGRNEGRPSCRKCNFVHYPNPAPCVAVMIVQSEKLLLTRRNIEPQMGMLDLPGGFLQWNESAEDAVIRECREELSVLISRENLRYLGSLPDVYGAFKTPTVNLCFLAEIASGILKAQSDVSSFEWHDLDNIPREFAFAHQECAVELLLHYLRGVATLDAASEFG